MELEEKNPGKMWNKIYIIASIQHIILDKMRTCL